MATSANSAALIYRLNAAVGAGNVITDPNRARRYCTGFRYGHGPALAVVRPRSLVGLWRALNACVDADAIVIMQAANTGLTGGSTPDGDDYDRAVILINTTKLAKVHVIEGGRQVICLAGATLHQLESVLHPLGRSPHSVIGSSCIGASVIGGICNNSGGSLIHRGPAYTQLALYAQVDDAGTLHLVNHLGVKFSGSAESILDKLERGAFSASDIERDSSRAASDDSYSRHVRDIDSSLPARFNADPKRLFEASGSAGRVVVFAVRLDTFEADSHTAVFYIGSNAAAELTRIRRHILAHFEFVPVSGEYIHRDAFDIAARYGKDMFLAIHLLGSGRLPGFFALKASFDSLVGRLTFLSPNLSDRLLQRLSSCFPNHIPRRMRAYRQQFEHHLMLKMAGRGIEEARAYLNSIFPSDHGASFECTPGEGEKAFLHRFAAAGAAVRYRNIHGDVVGGIVALDFALRRNERDWLEDLPPDLAARIVHKLYYGHFFCHVFHHDYIVNKGCDIEAVEHRLCEILDRRGAEYPAEHNVGHKYAAKAALIDHYKLLDPGNRFNPGIGRTSKNSHWR